MRPLPVASADSGHGADAVHEIGIWTYVPSGVRLLLPPPYRHDPEAAARLERAARRLEASMPWARVIRRRVSAGDRAGTAEKAQPDGVIRGKAQQLRGADRGSAG